MRVNVTEAHIARGQRGNANECAIAQALIDLGFIGASVASHIHYGEYAVPTPAEATAFIYAFDARHEVSPFSFEIPDIPADGDLVLA